MSDSPPVRYMRAAGPALRAAGPALLLGICIGVLVRSLSEVDPTLNVDGRGIDLLVPINVACATAAAMWNGWICVGAIRRSRLLRAAIAALAAVVSAYWGTCYTLLLLEQIPPAALGATLLRPTVPMLLLLAPWLAASAQADELAAIVRSVITEADEIRSIHEDEHDAFVDELEGQRVDPDRGT